jgi:hypothetical protein
MTVQQAIESYIFSLIALGLKVPMTNLEIAQLEYKVQEAFSDILDGACVEIIPNTTDNNISVVINE